MLIVWLMNMKDYLRASVKDERNRLLRVIAIYPAFDVEINEMAMVWKVLCNSKPVQCIVLAVQRDRLKGYMSSLTHEHFKNLEIYRYPSPQHIRLDLRRIAAKCKPDIIFCAVSSNMPLAMSLRRMTGGQIILHTEYFLDNENLLRRRYYLGLRFLQPLVYELYRRLLSKHTVRILCSNPEDFEPPRNHNFFKLRYLPWPHNVVDSSSFSQRDKNYCAYIGSISRAKGASNILLYFGHLLRHKPEMKLSVVGPAVDELGKKVIRAIKKIGQSRVDIITHCSRPKAVELLKKSLFVFSSGYRLGWGLIGDAWATGTPLLSVHKHYDLIEGGNCIIVRRPSEFLDSVKQLQTDEALWKRLSMGGRETVKSRHSIEYTAEILFEQLSEASLESTGCFSGKAFNVEYLLDRSK